MNLDHAGGAAFGDAGVGDAGKHRLMNDARELGMAVYCAEVDNVAGIGIAQHAFVLGGEAAGGMTSKRKTSSTLRSRARFIIGVEFAGLDFLLGSVGETP